MADTPEFPAASEDEIEKREQEKLDIGDSHPASRELRPDDERQGEGTDVGDPRPHDRDALPADPETATEQG